MRAARPARPSHRFATRIGEKVGLVLAAAALSACASSAPPPATEPVPGSQLVLGTHWMRNSAERRAVFLQTFRLAGERLEEVVREREPGTWAVALDADETMIDNSLYEKELIESRAPSSDDRWRAWVARQEAPPLPGARTFLARVRELGGHIAVVTNRKERDCPDTAANLRKAELPFDVLLCRGEDREKEPRWQAVRDGTAEPDLPPVEIVMWLGDNIHDFPGLEQELRFAPDEAYEAFGDSYFVFPNPLYGSWVENPED